MLYLQEELPESVFRSLLSAPYARKIFSQAYDDMWQKFSTSRDSVDEGKRNEAAVAAAWNAVKEAYGLAY